MEELHGKLDPATEELNIECEELNARGDEVEEFKCNGDDVCTKAGAEDWKRPLDWVFPYPRVDDKPNPKLDSTGEKLKTEGELKAAGLDALRSEECKPNRDGVCPVDGLEDSERPAQLLSQVREEPDTVELDATVEEPGIKLK